MRLNWALGAVMVMGLANAGCSVSAGSFMPVSVATPPVVPEAPPPVLYGAFLDGPVGSKLSQADRDKALASQQAALASGQRTTWKGDRGTFGYVEPGPAPAIPAAASPEAGQPGSAAAAATACRSFTSTIYLGGRPQVGHGKGCANPDGSYRVVS